MPAINLKKFSRSNVNIPDPIPEQSKDVDETKYNVDEDNNHDDNNNEVDDDFQDLNNENFVAEVELEKQKKNVSVKKENYYVIKQQMKKDRSN